MVRSILGGVVGGLIAFGVLGIFIGPTVLAVAYTLLKAWIAEGDAESVRELGDALSPLGEKHEAR